jgi:prepilin-type processing-associated H-X9-DG protein
MFSASSLGTPPNQSPVLAVKPFTSWGEGTAILTTGPFVGQLLAVGSPGVYLANVTGTLPANAMLFISRPGEPVGIDVSPASGPAIHAGDVVVSYADGHVERYDSSGNLLDSAYAAGLGAGSFCEFDDGGNLYIATFTGQIWKVHPDKTKVIINPTDPITDAIGIAVCKRCHEDDGEGEIPGEKGGKAQFSIHEDDCKELPVESESFTDSDSDVKFLGTRVTSLTHANMAHTVTIVGLGTNNGLPVAFTIVATDSTLMKPGMFKITLSNGYTNSGNLLDGSITVH